MGKISSFFHQKKCQDFCKLNLFRKSILIAKRNSRLGILYEESLKLVYSPFVSGLSTALVGSVNRVQNIHN